MPQSIDDKRVFSLLEVALSIQKTLADRYRSTFWVKAEMNKLNHYTHSGHCYPELLEKKDGRVIAQMKSNLWRADFQRINHKFLTILKEPLKDGINILFAATIIFDPAHGLSLRIVDIDPSFSLGELEREKQETLQRLRDEGIFDRNKRLNLPLLPQRIAVISVETSKGLADYLKVIEQNPYGYKFFNFLFPALLQGDRSVGSIMYQLKRIKNIVHHFDAVAIIRGGGGDVGLSSYNNYHLAREIALFPIPVFTGIGHSTNETVSEMVSFQNAITPTELADFLIVRFHEFSGPVKRAEEIIVARSRHILGEQKSSLTTLTKYFQSITHNRLLKSHNETEKLSTTLLHLAKFRLKEARRNITLMIPKMKEELETFLIQSRLQITNRASQLSVLAEGQMKDNIQKVEQLARQVNVLDPINILKRGFSITLLNGKSVKHVAELKADDTLTTIVADGQFTSSVKQIIKKDNGSDA